MRPVKGCETVLSLYRGLEPQEGFQTSKAASPAKAHSSEGCVGPFNRTPPMTLLFPPRAFFLSLRAYRQEERKQI